MQPEQIPNHPAVSMSIISAAAAAAAAR